MKRGGSFLLTIFLMTFSPAICRAGLFRVESETFSSLRNGDDFKLELPNYEFLGANYTNDDRSLDMNANFSVFDDPIRGENDFKLYLLNVAYRPLKDRVNVYAGRTFDVDHVVRTSTIDSVGVDVYFLNRQVTVGTFVGQEHQIELDGSEPAANVAGVYGSYSSSSFLPLFIKGKLQYTEYTRISDQPQYLTQWSLQQPFAGRWSPTFLFDSELNIATANLNRLETGFDFYPTTRSAFRMRGLTYDATSQDGIEQPLFSTFAQGRLFQGSAELEYRFSPQVSASLLAAYDNFLLQTTPSTRTSGFDLESNLQIFFNRFYSMTDGIYALQSYGGSADGTRFLFAEKLTDRVDFNEIAELTYYNKITSSKRGALDASVMINYIMSNQLRLSSGVEYGSNNELAEDARIFGKLVYLLWAEQ